MSSSTKLIMMVMYSAVYLQDDNVCVHISSQLISTLVPRNTITRNRHLPSKLHFPGFTSPFSLASSISSSNRGSNLFITLLSCGLGFTGAVAEAPGPAIPGSVGALLEPSSLDFVYSARWAGGMLDWIGSVILWWFVEEELRLARLFWQG